MQFPAGAAVCAEFHTSPASVASTSFWPVRIVVAHALLSFLLRLRRGLFRDGLGLGLDRLLLDVSNLVIHEADAYITAIVLSRLPRARAGAVLVIALPLLPLNGRGRLVSLGMRGDFYIL